MSYYPRRTAEPAKEPVTLEEALEHLREDAGIADARIESLIKTARMTCEARIERTLISTPWAVTMDAFPSAVILFRPPVIAVQSVTYIDADGATQTLDPQDYLVDVVSEPGYLVPGVGKSWPSTQERINAVTVAYTAGFGTEPEDVPEPLRQWILLAVGDMYSRRNRSAEKAAVPQDFADSLLDEFKIMRL